MPLLLVLSALLAGAVLAPLLVRLPAGLRGPALAAIPAGVFVMLVDQVGAVHAGSFLTVDLPWFPALDAHLRLRLDGLGLLMGLLAGLVMLGGIAGTYTLSELPARSQSILAHPWAPATILLILAGALAARCR